MNRKLPGTLRSLSIDSCEEWRWSTLPAGLKVFNLSAPSHDLDLVHPFRPHAPFPDGLEELRLTFDEDFLDRKQADAHRKWWPTGRFTIPPGLRKLQLNDVVCEDADRLRKTRQVCLQRRFDIQFCGVRP